MKKEKVEKEYNELDLMEATRLAKERAEHEMTLRKLAKPSLLARYFSSFLDIIFIIIGMLVISLPTLSLYLNVTHYSDYVAEASEVAKSSGLYDYVDEIVVEKEYNSNEYEKVIINYYSTNSYAISKNKLEEYNKDKKDSNLFDSDGKLLTTADESAVKTFYSNQYEYAIYFLKTDPNYIIPMNKTLVIMYFYVLILMVISTSIFYFIIPMCRKEGETLGQIIFKICVIDSKDLSFVKKWQVCARFVFVLSFNYLFGAVLWVVFTPGICLLPLLVSIFVIGFSKTNQGPQDRLTRTIVITKSRTNAAQVFDEISKMSARKY